jgi:hypothetical protein
LFCGPHAEQLKSYIESLKPKRNEPLTWRLEPHGSRPVQGTRMGSLFGCEVWYDPDMVQKAYNEWQENHVEPKHVELKVHRGAEDYFIDHGDGFTRLSPESANAIYEYIKRERGENA